MALPKTELDEIRHILWSVLDWLDAGSETEIAALLAQTLDAILAER